MKVLTITNAYPTKRNPHRGLYIANQVRSLDPYIKPYVLYKAQKSWIGYFMFGLNTTYSCLKRDYDLIHAHYGFHSALSPVICRCHPLIVTFHGSDAYIEPRRNKLYKALQLKVISYASHIIAVSKQIRTILIDDYGADPGKISIIPCGVDTKKFRPRSKENIRNRLDIDISSRVALFIGRLSKAKGVDLILEAARKLRDVEFYLIGEGKMQVDAPNCNFIGVLHHTKIPEWINAADVLLLPSKSEGTPGVVLEALASETPVICSRVGACPELIIEGVTGLLLPSRSVESLINAIKLALYRITFKTKVGREMMIHKYGLEQIASQLYQLYCHIYRE